MGSNHEKSEFLTGLCCRKDACDLSVSDYGNAVTCHPQLLKLGGYHDDGCSRFLVISSQCIEDQGFGTDVDASGRFADDEKFRLKGKSLCEADLLLVAA